METFYHAVVCDGVLGAFQQVEHIHHLKAHIVLSSLPFARGLFCNFMLISIEHYVSRISLRFSRWLSQVHQLLKDRLEISGRLCIVKATQIHTPLFKFIKCNPFNWNGEFK